MLRHDDLQLLSQWCSHRDMRWYPGCGDDAMVLERIANRRPFQRMLLVRQADEFLLRDERSATLAAASDLPALFDAVDAGVADATLPA